MEDLSGLDWNAKPASRPPVNAFAGQAPLRPISSPSRSGRSTPLSSQRSGTDPTTSQQSNKPPQSNGFSALLAPKPSRPSTSLSLQEKQKQLQAQKNLVTNTGQDPYNLGNQQFWEGLGSGRGTPTPVCDHDVSTIVPFSNYHGTQADQTRSRPKSPGERELLAAFSEDAPVDASSHLPSPAESPTPTIVGQPPVPRNNAKLASSIQAASPAAAQDAHDVLEDEDPFGLGQMTQKPHPNGSHQVNVDDDILGDLGKPVREVSVARQSGSRGSADRPSQKRVGPKDKALAELVDMGFPPDRAQYALDQTDSGQDVQAAVSVLLNEAHSASNNKSKSRPDQPRRGSSSRANQRTSIGARTDNDPPPWLNGTTRASSRPGTKEPAGEQKEVAQYATEIGTSMWKSANSLWKSGQKKMAQAVADLQQDGDPNQPRWLHEGPEEASTPREARQRPGRQNHKATDEAAMLDNPRTATPPRQRPSHTQSRRRSSLTERAEQKQSPSSQSARTQPRTQSARPDLASRQIQRVSRQAVEDETAQAYVSPARRRKQQTSHHPPPEANPQPKPVEAESLDIFSTNPISQYSQPSAPRKAAPPAAVPIRSKARPRSAPSVSTTTLEASHRHRKAGTDAFKRGDYVSAQNSYSTALNALPSSHPVTIVLRCNRAITLIRSGDAKSALVDADTALETIGPARGEGESISLGPDEGDKPMKEFFGKALLRKAEALEHLEKWPEAAQVWRDAVQAGVGGSVAIQGRNRCEEAAETGSAAQGNGIVSKSKPKPEAAARPRPKPPAMSDFGQMNMGETEAVKRLREAEAAATRASDEAFALTDAVEARITTWKGGKSDNLRALLASLDTILWADAGWNKVGMGDLVLPNRVKIIYMKAIAKVHPDKVKFPLMFDHSTY